MLADNGFKNNSMLFGSLEKWLAKNNSIDKMAEKAFRSEKDSFK